LNTINSNIERKCVQSTFLDVDGIILSFKRKSK